MADRILFAKELDEDISRAVQAKHIATDLTRALSVRLDENPLEAHRKLAERYFDQAPVVNPQGRPIGWVTAKDLERAHNVDDVYKRLENSRIMSSDTSIDEVLHPLDDDKFVFVVNGPDIGGFITPSDVDRNAVRSYFYLQICAIESYLAAIVANSVSQRQVEAKIATTDMYEEWLRAKSDSNETDSVEYLYFSGLVALFVKNRASKEMDAGLRKGLKALVGFRNDVFHPVRSLVKGRDIGVAVRRSDQSRQIIEVLACIARRLYESPSP